MFRYKTTSSCFLAMDRPSAGMLVAMVVVVVSELAAQTTNSLTPLVRVVDLNVGETQPVRLSDGRSVTVTLLDLKETRDRVRNAVRRAVVTLDVEGTRVDLTSATYHLPTTVGSVQVDCSVTKGYTANGRSDAWGLEKDARIRLWPADSPLVRPGTFVYPAKQRWFATHTQMANVPTFVDGGERPSNRTSIYYHSGLDIGGTEGRVEVVAATDGVVMSAGDQARDDIRRDTPVAPRYDVVYVRDARGWYYRYSHMKEIDAQIKPGRVVRKGDRIGWLGKEGGSGGWSHLHFEIKARQPSGKWGTQAGYAFLWEAYLRQYRPALIAVARPHHVLWAGETATLDGGKSWTAAGRMVSYQWQFHDGSSARGPRVERSYGEPGTYSEVLKVTNEAGQVDYDFAIVQVIDRNHPDRLPPTIHPTYAPTFDIKPGDPVTFTVRTFRTTDGRERWDFGDGSPPVEVQSDGNVEPHAADGYAVTAHRYERPGHYLVRVERENRYGMKAIGHLQVRVGESREERRQKVDD